MPNISKNEYEEFKKFRHKQELKKIWESQESIVNLEDDIDLPIRNLVAMFALCGCSPIYSCCGFDYKGQPYHKSHQYGEPYIMFSITEASKTILGGIQSELPPTWWIKAKSNKIFLSRRFAVQNPHWNLPTSPHFMEELVMELSMMEKSLIPLLYPIMQEEVILEDSNEIASKLEKYWQYTPKNPWVITKDSFYV